MKALEYLYRMLKANQEIGNTPENILECIAELEALQQRSCATCEYDGTFRYMGKDSRCTRCCNFFSNRYVPKDNQRNQHLMIRESK